MSRKIPATEHTARPWRIHELAPDFEVEDVWALELHDECAAELANRTVHDICHLGWVPTADGGYELRMAALVKPNGLPGRLYMAAIKPFRYLVVYPALTRQWERAWRERTVRIGTESGAVR